MTEDVCDVCWGSGNQDRPYPSHRTFERMCIEHRDLCEALMDMVNGHCYLPGGIIDNHTALSCNEEAIELLRQLGLVEETKNGFRLSWDKLPKII